MKKHIHVLSAIIATFFYVGIASAQGISDGMGILPGEPDPNAGPGSDKAHGAIVIPKEKTPCPPPKKRFWKTKCANTWEKEPQCENYAPVLECRLSYSPPKCKPPKKLMPVYRCVPREK